MAVIRRLVFLALLIAAVSWPFTGRGQTGAKNGEWRAYSAEEASTRYSPVDQITRDNVKQPRGCLDLEVRQLRIGGADGDDRNDAAHDGREAVLHSRVSAAPSSRPTPVPAKRSGRGGPTRVRASTRRHARSIAASPTGATVRKSALSSSHRGSSWSRSMRRPAGRSRASDRAASSISSSSSISMCRSIRPGASATARLR